MNVPCFLELLVGEKKVQKPSDLYIFYLPGSSNVVWMIRIREPASSTVEHRGCHLNIIQNIQRHSPNKK